MWSGTDALAFQPTSDCPQQITKLLRIFDFAKPEPRDALGGQVASGSFERPPKPLGRKNNEPPGPVH